MSSMTGVADSCSPNSHGDGWPRPAQARPPPASRKTVTLVTTKAINRLSTSIVLLRSLDEKIRYGGPLAAALRRLEIPARPRSARRLATGVAALAVVRAGRGKSRFFKP